MKLLYWSNLLLLLLLVLLLSVYFYYGTWYVLVLFNCTAFFFTVNNSFWYFISSLSTYEFDPWFDMFDLYVIVYDLLSASFLYSLILNNLSKYLYTYTADLRPNKVVTSLYIFLGKCCNTNWLINLKYNELRFYNDIVIGFDIFWCFQYLISSMILISQMFLYL